MQTRNLIRDKLKEVDVVILCGGMGSRLAPVVNDRPKPMAEINHQPFLDILIDYFSDFGFKRFILCTGHRSEVIREYYDSKPSELEIVISNEQTPLGTAGAVKNAESFIRSNPFLVANGDSFCSVDLSEFFDFHSRKSALLSIAVVESEQTSDMGLISLDNAQRITGFEEKKQRVGNSYINTGLYLFQKDVLKFIPANMKHSMEYDLFPALTNQNIYGFVSLGELIDIGAPQRLESAKEFFS